MICAAVDIHDAQLWLQGARLQIRNIGVDNLAVVWRDFGIDRSFEGGLGQLRNTVVGKSYQIEINVRKQRIMIRRHKARAIHQPGNALRQRGSGQFCARAIAIHFCACNGYGADAKPLVKELIAVGRPDRIGAQNGVRDSQELKPPNNKMKG